MQYTLRRVYLVHLWFYGRATSSHHLRTSLSLFTCAVYAFPALVGTFDYRLQFRHFTNRQSASPAYCIYCKLWTSSNYGRLFFRAFFYRLMIFHTT
jgi:hypothetical protein